MAKVNGADVILRVEGSTSSSWDIVGCQTGMTITETQDAIDVSCKGQRAGSFLPGRYGSTFSLDGLVQDPYGDGFSKLQSGVRDGKKVKVDLYNQDSSSSYESADVIVTNLQRDYPDQAGSTYSVSGTVDGEWS